jgi:hypothetical protein
MTYLWRLAAEPHLERRTCFNLAPLPKYVMTTDPDNLSLSLAPPAAALPVHACSEK